MYMLNKKNFILIIFGILLLLVLISAVLFFGIFVSSTPVTESALKFLSIGYILLFRPETWIVILISLMGMVISRLVEEKQRRRLNFSYLIIVFLYLGYMVFRILTIS